MNEFIKVYHCENAPPEMAKFADPKCPPSFPIVAVEKTAPEAQRQFAEHVARLLNFETTISRHETATDIVFTRDYCCFNRYDAVEYRAEQEAKLVVAAAAMTFDALQGLIAKGIKAQFSNGFWEERAQLKPPAADPPF